MKSSMTFIQTYGWTEIDLILNKYGGGLNDDRSALSKRAWVILVITYPNMYCIIWLALYISLTNHIARHIRSPVPASLSIWQKPRGMKLYEALKEGKRANDSDPLWASSSNTSGSAPDTAITGKVQIIGRNSRFIGYFVTKTKKNTEKNTWRFKVNSSSIRQYTFCLEIQSINWGNPAFFDPSFCCTFRSHRTLLSEAVFLWA